MIRSQYALIAEYVQEGVSGKYNILGVFDRIFVLSTPAQFERLSFVALLIADKEDDLGKKPLCFRVTAPDGSKLFEQWVTVDFKPVAGTWFASNRLTLGLGGFPLPTMGKYRFVLELGGKEIVSCQLSVVLGPPPP